MSPINIATTGANYIGRAATFVWHWSVPYRSANKPIDKTYAAIWSTPVDDESIRNALQPIEPGTPRNELPIDEEAIRLWLRNHYLTEPSDTEDEDSIRSEKVKSEDGASEQQHVEIQSNVKQLPEEAWEHLPMNVRNLLAAMNAHNIERKLETILEEPFHTSAGNGSIRRAQNGISKTFRMFRLGFREAVSSKERIGVQIFFVILAFSACYPDVAAGFLHERSYNQRSIGSRIVTLCQLFSLWTFPHHSVWLLFNWSLERLLGAFVGNTVYALAAIIPSLHRIYRESWFRFMLLGLSMSWQIGVQFSPALRDYILRLVTRRQMSRMRMGGDTESITWSEVDKIARWELMSIQAYAKHILESGHLDTANVPFKVRAERFIHFTKSFSLGRPSDQLIGLLKEDMEGVIATFEDYVLSNPDNSKTASSDKGYREPMLPKMLLVIFDVGIFTYITYSFWTQPFVFNTTVAYGTVVCIKQLLMALKRYQTAKAAMRLVTNMVSINILGIFLVSTPVTINRHVLDSTTNFVCLTLAMVVASVFLAEPIAPLVVKAMESLVALGLGIKGKITSRRHKRQIAQHTDESKFENLPKA